MSPLTLAIVAARDLPIWTVAGIDACDMESEGPKGRLIAIHRVDERLPWLGGPGNRIEVVFDADIWVAVAFDHVHVVFAGAGFFQFNLNVGWRLCRKLVEGFRTAGIEATPVTVEVVGQAGGVAGNRGVTNQRPLSLAREIFALAKTIAGLRRSATAATLATTVITALLTVAIGNTDALAGITVEATATLSAIATAAVRAAILAEAVGFAGALPGEAVVSQRTSAADSDAAIISALFVITLGNANVVRTDEIRIAVIVLGAGSTLATAAVASARLVGAIRLALPVGEDIVGVHAPVWFSLAVLARSIGRDTASAIAIGHQYCVARGEIEVGFA